MRKFFAILAIAALASAACDSSAPPPSPTPAATTVINRGYIAMLETPEGTVRTPDFTLPAATGGELTLSELRGSVPLAVIFYRGHFCGVCRTQLEDLQEVYGDIQAMGAELVAISVDDPEDAQATVELLDLQFPVLYDNDFAVSMDWNVFNLLDDGVAAPGAFIFDTDGELVAYRIGETISERPTAREVVDVLADADS